MLSDALQDPDLQANSDFWQEYGDLAKKGKVPDHELAKLIEKHRGQRPQERHPTSHQPAASTDIVIHKSAQKEIKKLPSHLKNKVDEFISKVSQPDGIQDIKKNNHSWNLEELAQFGPNAHSVRINGGYRILFDLTEDRVTVRAVNKGHIHSN